MNDQVDYERIKASSLGAELDLDECRTLAGLMKIRRLAAGDVLVAEGQVDDKLYLLAEGKLMVSSNVGGAETTLYTLGRGECAGTRAFIDHTPRKASLCATRDTVVYALAPDEFESLVDTQPRVVYKVMRAIFRVAHTNLMRMDLECEQLLHYITKTGGRY